MRKAAGRIDKGKLLRDTSGRAVIPPKLALAHKALHPCLHALSNILPVSRDRKDTLKILYERKGSPAMMLANR